MKCGEELCGRSTGKKKTGLASWWWNDETESAVREKKERLKIWKRTGEENDEVEYKTAKGEAKSAVARVKAEAIGLYDQLETVEGQQEIYRYIYRIYRIAAARDRSGKDICQIRNGFGVEVGPHQGSALSPYLFLLLMDVLTEDVRKDVPGSMMFADDIVLCGVDETDMTEYLET